MTQSSEERVTQQPAQATSARIIPFERPQSELQRAVQERAQQRIEAAQVKPKVSPVRRIVTFAVALIPVGLIFTGFLLAVHAVRVITSIYSKAAPAQVEQEPAPEAEPSRPGVIFLVPEKQAAPEAPAQPDAPASQVQEPQKAE